MRKVLVFGLTFSLAGASLYACSDNTTDATDDTPGVDSSTPDAKSSTFGDSFVPDSRTSADDSSTRPDTSTGPTDAAKDVDGDAPFDGGGVVLPAGSGNFTVVRVGAPTDTLGTAAFALFLEERSLTDGTVVKTTALPIAVSGANFPITLRGSVGTAEGALALSSDGHYLVLAGFSSIPGTATPAAATVIAPRVVARIDKDGTVDTSTTLGAVAYAGGAARGVASADGTSFYVAGEVDPAALGGGVWYAPLASAAPTQVFSAVGNLRGVGIFDAQLFATTGASTDYHVFSIGAGLPTVDSPATALPGFGTTYAPGSLVMLDTDAVAGVDTMYVAETESIATNGGVQKWKLAAGTWTLAATFKSDFGTNGPLFVNAKVVGTDVIVVATTAESAARVIRFVDDGVSTTPTGITIATGVATHTSFRGVAFPAQ